MCVKFSFQTFGNTFLFSFTALVYQTTENCAGSYAQTHIFITSFSGKYEIRFESVYFLILPIRTLFVVGYPVILVLEVTKRHTQHIRLVSRLVYTILILDIISANIYDKMTGMVLLRPSFIF